MNPLHAESAVKSRYAAGAQAVEPALCCPVPYRPELLKIIPAEVIARDYGCGDPSQHVHPGETVLDLGSGTGKICFIAAQVVGPTGRVIGVDMTDEMLGVARGAAPVVAEPRATPSRGGRSRASSSARSPLRRTKASRARALSATKRSSTAALSKRCSTTTATASNAASGPPSATKHSNSLARHRIGKPGGLRKSSEKAASRGDCGSAGF